VRASSALGIGSAAIFVPLALRCGLDSLEYTAAKKVATRRNRCELRWRRSDGDGAGDVDREIWHSYPNAGLKGGEADRISTDASGVDRDETGKRKLP
jgi:hypothetical protein